MVQSRLSSFSHALRSHSPFSVQGHLDHGSIHPRRKRPDTPNPNKKLDQVRPRPGPVFERLAPEALTGPRPIVSSFAR